MELQQGRGIFAPSARVSHNDARDFVQTDDWRDFDILLDERAVPGRGPGIGREPGQFDGCEFAST
jgi:hypothetical protein